MGSLLKDQSDSVLKTPLPAQEAKLGDLVRAVRSVPVAPEVLPRLQAKLRDFETDSSDLAELIKLDAGLASTVLRASNSAYYARAAEVTDLDEAVAVLGYQESLRLVARCSFSAVMQGSLEQYGFEGGHLWRQAVLTAFAMEELCSITGADSSLGYVAGLLHAVGMVAINDFLMRRGFPVSPVAASSNQDFVRWEMKTIGFHHGQVGAAMMRDWLLPSTLARIVERQFEERLGAEEPTTHFLLPLSVALAHRVILTSEGKAVEDASFDQFRMRRAGLDGEQIAEAAATIAKHWAKLRNTLA